MSRITNTNPSIVEKFAEKFVANNEMMNEGKKSAHNVSLLISVLRLRQELMRMTMPDTHVF